MGVVLQFPTGKKKRAKRPKKLRLTEEQKVQLVQLEIVKQEVLNGYIRSFALVKQHSRKGGDRLEGRFYFREDNDVLALSKFLDCYVIKLINGTIRAGNLENDDS